MKQAKKTHWLRTTLLVLIACAVVGTGISAVRFITNPSSPTYASSYIQLTFDGAASGVAPNGHQFDMKDIFCEEVIQQALKEAGLENRYTAEQVQDQLSIEGDYPADINQQMMNYDSILDFNANRTVAMKSFYPTMFTVRLYNEFDKTISKADLEALLNGIMASAKAYFTKVYSLSTQSEAFSFDLSEYDYSYQLLMLSTSLNQTLSYAQSLYEKAPAFTYHGYGFDEIVIRLNNLINNEIDRLNAMVVLSVFSKNNQRLLLDYQYKIEYLSIVLKNRTECLQQLDKLNNSYQKNEIIYLSNADTWTKIDGDASSTYDKLVAKRKELADSITRIKSEIERYTMLMNDVNTAPSQTAEADSSGESIAQNAALLDSDIQYIIENYQAVKNDLSDLIRAYNDCTINDSTVQVVPAYYFSLKLISFAFIRDAFTTIAPLCSLGLMVCLVLIIVSRRKEQKAA